MTEGEAGIYKAGGNIGTDELVEIVDAMGGRVQSIGIVNVLKSAIAQQESLWFTTSVREVSANVAAAIDSESCCGRSVRNIDRGVGPTTQFEAVHVAILTSVVADNLPGIVDPKCVSVRAARIIEGCVSTIDKCEGVNQEAIIVVTENDT